MQFMRLLLAFVLQIGVQTLAALFLPEILYRYPPSSGRTCGFYLLGAARLVSGVVVSNLLMLQRGEE